MRDKYIISIRIAIKRLRQVVFKKTGITIGLFILLIILAFLTAGCNRAEVSEYSAVILNPLMTDPFQEPLVNPESYTFTVPNVLLRISPIARYRLVAMVMSSKHYRLGWLAQLSPVDLALAWGRLTESEARKHITYSQSNRWYYFRSSANSPYDHGYIASHSSNHHLIPFTPNIRAALLGIKRGETIKLEGSLVNISGHVNGREYWWNSSLSRTDTGNGACEIFLVQTVQIGAKIYK